MPKLDGIATLSALRAIARFLQVIIVSGRATPEDAVQARALGAFDFVPKPIDFGYLISRVEAALRADSDATSDSMGASKAPNPPMVARKRPGEPGALRGSATVP
jgi:DNA-binding response OmpR family regulator